MGLHTAANEPLDQSVRNGTQSLDNLWRHRSSVMAVFRRSLDQCIRAYIDAMPEDDAHPFE